MTSIRRRLLLSLTCGLLVCAVFMMGIAYIYTTREIGELFSSNLRRIAFVLNDQSSPGSDTPQTANSKGHEELEESYVIQLWNADGTLRRSSDTDVAIPLQPNEGLNFQTVAGTDWQIYRLKSGKIGYIQVAQPQEIVATMVSESVLRTLWPLALLFIFLLFGIWHAVRRSLMPLNELSHTIAGWEADTMRPLVVESAPAEIQPVAKALNTLLQKLEKAMTLQQQFTADAAHELRTPLTAIKLQLDVFLRAKSEAERHDAVRQLAKGIDRSIHLANQLLVSSRSMAVKTKADFQTVRMDALVQSLLPTFTVLAENKKIALIHDNEEPCTIIGEEEGLRVLVSNLVDNAILYTPAEGAVQIRLYHAPAQVTLEVSDNGPGIPDKERGRVFQRFYRIAGTAPTGSGLGLSIVRNVAEAHDATIMIESGLQGKGTTVRIRFPIQGAA